MISFVVRLHGRFNGNLFTIFSLLFFIKKNITSNKLLKEKNMTPVFLLYRNTNLWVLQGSLMIRLKSNSSTQVIHC